MPKFSKITPASGPGQAKGSGSRNRAGADASRVGRVGDVAGPCAAGGALIGTGIGAGGGAGKEYVGGAIAKGPVQLACW